MENVKNAHISNFKIPKYENFQKCPWEGTPSRVNDTGRKSNHVKFGKGKVQGSQHTIDHIDTTLIARYIPTQTDLYWRKMPKMHIFQISKFQSMKIFDIFRQYRPVWVGM